MEGCSPLPWALPRREDQAWRWPQEQSPDPWCASGTERISNFPRNSVLAWSPLLTWPTRKVVCLSPRPFIQTGHSLHITSFLRLSSALAAWLSCSWASPWFVSLQMDLVLLSPVSLFSRLLKPHGRYCSVDTYVRACVHTYVFTCAVWSVVSNLRVDISDDD